MTSTVTEPVVEHVETVDIADEDVLAEVLVEEISIDGMCGVY
jgi:mycofactocin precursor